MKSASPVHSTTYLMQQITRYLTRSSQCTAKSSPHPSKNVLILFLVSYLNMILPISFRLVFNYNKSPFFPLRLMAEEGCGSHFTKISRDCVHFGGNFCHSWISTSSLRKNMTFEALQSSTCDLDVVSKN